MQTRSKVTCIIENRIDVTDNNGYTRKLCQYVSGDECWRDVWIDEGSMLQVLQVCLKTHTHGRRAEDWIIAEQQTRDRHRSGEIQCRIAQHETARDPLFGFDQSNTEGRDQIGSGRIASKHNRKIFVFFEICLIFGQRSMGDAQFSTILSLQQPHIELVGLVQCMREGFLWCEVVVKRNDRHTGLVSPDFEVDSMRFWSLTHPSTTVNVQYESVFGSGGPRGHGDSGLL
mmetsp:Transcript_29992/g.75488  ORF Transcript_29992/g.75488 Transcript_29992/m.75488 type:complete len:229 (+) Transcript_29992:205-891(+)